MPRVSRGSEAGVGPSEAVLEEGEGEARGGAEETQADADYRRQWDPPSRSRFRRSTENKRVVNQIMRDWREARQAGSAAGSKWSERAEREPWWNRRDDGEATGTRAVPKSKTEEADRPGDVGKDDKPPSWSGKEPKLQTYIRKVNLWCAYTRTPENRRGIRLLAGLDGDAFDKMELVMPEELVRSDGVSYFLSLLRAKYEPLENKRIGKVMDDFLFKFDRRNDEEIND
jgi:hypothetical protein